MLRLSRDFFRKSTALFLILIFPLATSAHEVFRHPVKDIKALEKTLPQPEFLRGNFEQVKTVADLKKKFNSRGKFIFSKEKGLYLQTQKPFSSTIIFTQHGILKIEGGERTVVEQQPVLKEFSDIFRSVFSGDNKKLQENFEIFFMSTKTGWILGLRPNNKFIKDSIKEITLKGQNQIKEIMIYEQSEDTMLIKFDNIKTAPLTKNEEAYFNF